MDKRRLALGIVLKNFSKKGLQKEPKANLEWGSLIFNDEVMKRHLPADLVEKWQKTRKSAFSLEKHEIELIANALKLWAQEKGAHYYTHWFHPMSGVPAEKHDSFMCWDQTGLALSKLSSSQLLQGEPDASSFPSGGLRSTYEARGYTGWDPTSPPFLWKGGDGFTLCIPSVFVSWKGELLDNKVPLMRSEERLSSAVERLFKVLKIDETTCFSTLGLEQEYFLIDRVLKNARSDLSLIGKTVYGRAASKGQELQDHYFGSIKDRILSFMQDFEGRASALGIPVKTRHNEVAPSQYEVAPLFEKTSLAIDHNVLLMEVMKQTAHEHGLSCLLHEKPFKGMNGSGKHANWSLSTESGKNLFDPFAFKETELPFLLLLVSLLKGIHRHADLLRAAIASASNDERLGGHEAPPAIISVFLGEDLENLLDALETGKQTIFNGDKKTLKMSSKLLPDLQQDNTDRNRTSPFAFTGSKFEFRSVGSSSNPAFAITVLNLILAEVLEELLIEVEGRRGDELHNAIQKYLKEGIKLSKPIRFGGDNYGESWFKEAKKRKLPLLEDSVDALPVFLSKKSIKLFEGTLTERELGSRFEILTENYLQQMFIEARLMKEIFSVDIFPATLKFLESLSESSLKSIQKRKKEVENAFERALSLSNELGSILEKQEGMSLDKKLSLVKTSLKPIMQDLRKEVDLLEGYVADNLWPLLKYEEILFLF